MDNIEKNTPNNKRQTIKNPRNGKQNGKEEGIPSQPHKLNSLSAQIYLNYDFFHY